MDGGNKSGPKKSTPRPAGAMGFRQKTVPLDDGTDVRQEMHRAIRAQRRPVFVVIQGADIGLRCKLEGSSVIVGRDPAAGLVLTDPGTSWMHACVEDRGDCWAVVDLGSTNGTFLGAERVTDALLKPNDKITFGRTVVRFELHDAIEDAFGEMVERMLNIDDLSGLFLRRKFDSELAVLLSAAQASHKELGLIVMDLDGVKVINDTHGHLYGAYVIGETGRLIARLIEGRGIGTRFGGDEYIAALPSHDITATAAVGEQILQAVRTHHFEREGIVLRPGISLGVAAYPQSAMDAQSLFQRADEAMYRAKQGGRNRLCR